jgi:glycosyl transferase family 61
MNTNGGNGNAAIMEPPRGAPAHAQKITPLASFVHPEPPLPRSIDGRRLDVFQAYQANVRALASRAPIQAYTIESPSLELELHPDRKTLAARGGDGKMIPDLFAYPGGAVADFDEHLFVTTLAGKSLIAAEGNSPNYYHFLFNSIVRLAVVMKTHPLEKFDHVIVTDDSPPFVWQALDMLGVRPEQVVGLNRTPRVRCERAFYGQYISHLIYPHRLSAQLLRGIFPTSLCAARRLYIVRQGQRSVVNQDEVWNLLRPRGFEMVRCEQLSLLEQVRLFASAEAVISPHGAGLSNIVFCPPGAKIIEFHPPRFVQTVYWFLAASCGQDYAMQIGRGDDPPLSDKNGPDGWRSGIADRIDVSLDKLERLCGEMGL